ncbi:MAG: hypothetical protein KA015_04570 [Spirochaetes bacterium]|nr:hypothetical protein [Spirochaetota bacterium]
MRVLVCLLFAVIAFSFSSLKSQETKPEGTDKSLSSESLSNEARDLDNQILELSKKISDTVKKYNLASAKEIPVLPYQVSFEAKDGYILITRYFILKDDITGKLNGSREKKMKLYLSGDSVSKIESVIFEKENNKFTTNLITIVDPSPTAAGTDDVTFNHSVNDKVRTGSKPLGEIRNTTAFPIRNNIKRDFYIPHLQYFYSIILSIGETYQKGIKDSDAVMQNILKNSTNY